MTTILGLILMTPFVWVLLSHTVFITFDATQDNFHISLVIGFLITLALWGLYLIFFL